VRSWESDGEKPIVRRPGIANAHPFQLLPGFHKICWDLLQPKTLPAGERGFLLEFLLRLIQGRDAFFKPLQGTRRSA
jgi:hypothetical protein